MSRRRYLSTEISIDTAVNRLARTTGDFAVMLYTWMIPHCDDDGIVHGDAEELILQVIPGRRDKKIEDVTTALAAMQEHGLIEWDQEGRCVRFPVDSFYKYQTYIKPERRRGAASAENNNAPEVAQDADNSAKHRTSPQNTVSLSHSPSLSHPDQYMCASRAHFDEAWALYPKKANKAKALARWVSMPITQELFTTIMAAIRDQATWPQWMGGVVPHMTTWLNGSRWEDEKPCESTETSNPKAARFPTQSDHNQRRYNPDGSLRPVV